MIPLAFIDVHPKASDHVLNLNKSSLWISKCSVHYVDIASGGKQFCGLEEDSASGVHLINAVTFYEARLKRTCWWCWSVSLHSDRAAFIWLRTKVTEDLVSSTNIVGIVLQMVAAERISDLLRVKLFGIDDIQGIWRSSKKVGNIHITDSIQHRGAAKVLSAIIRFAFGVISFWIALAFTLIWFLERDLR